jgi:predicted nuclease of predicted toxin-antitoxin system
LNLFIDEDLSPTLVGIANERGYEATCARDRDNLGRTDAAVLSFCVEEDRVIVTGNAGDFTGLCGSVEIHPGLITLPHGARATQQELLEAALTHIEARANEVGDAPRDFMLNRVIEVDLDGTCTDSVLPHPN